MTIRVCTFCHDWNIILQTVLCIEHPSAARTTQENTMLARAMLKIYPDTMRERVEMHGVSGPLSRPQGDPRIVTALCAANFAKVRVFSE